MEHADAMTGVEVESMRRWVAAAANDARDDEREAHGHRVLRGNGTHRGQVNRVPVTAGQRLERYTHASGAQAYVTYIPCEGRTRVRIASSPEDRAVTVECRDGIDLSEPDWAAAGYTTGMTFAASA